MALIASLNVVLSATSTAFSTAMKSAKSSLSDFGEAVTSTKGLLIGALGAVGVGLSVEAFKTWVEGAAEAMDSTAKLSDRIGISTEGLVGLQHAAKLSGVASEELTGGLEKMLRALSPVGQGSAETMAAFGRLGLNVQNLANMAPEEAFKRIADALANVKNPAERAGDAVAIFGRSGQALLPMLMEGSEGLQAAQREAEKLGITFSRVDAAKVEAANDAMEKLGEAVTGVGQALAVKLAPFVTFVTDKITNFGTEGHGAIRLASASVEWLAKGLAATTDVLNLLDAGWQVLRGTAAWVLGFVIERLGDFIAGLEFIYEKITGTASHFGEGMRKIGEAVVQEGTAAFHKAGADWDNFMNRTNSRQVNNFFDDLNRSADASAQAIVKSKGAMGALSEQAEDNSKKISETLGSLQKQVDTFGMSEGQKKLFDLKQLGASSDQLKVASDLVDKLDKLDLEKKGKELAKSLETPLEKLKEEQSQYRHLLSAGQISQSAFDRAMKKSEVDFLKAEGMGEHKNEKVAAEARSYTFKIPEQHQQQQDIAKLNKTQLDALVEQRKQTFYGREVWRILSTGGPTNSVSIPVA